MAASGFGVRVTGLVFVFESTSLALKQVPTCIRKPKTNIFDKSIKFLHWLFLVVLNSFRSFQMVFRLFQVVLDRFSLFQIVLDRFRSFQVVPHFSKYPAYHQIETLNFKLGYYEVIWQTCRSLGKIQKNSCNKPGHL